MRLTEEDFKRAEANAPADHEIDYSDIPETTEADWANARLIRVSPKETTIQIDEDLLSYFRAQGKNYQQRINAVLRAYVNAHS